LSKALSAIKLAERQPAAIRQTIHSKTLTIRQGGCRLKPLFSLVLLLGLLVFTSLVIGVKEKAQS
jgi:hypothetical protein